MHREENIPEYRSEPHRRVTERDEVARKLVANVMILEIV